MSCVAGYLCKTKISQYSAVYKDAAINQSYKLLPLNVTQWCTATAGTSFIGLAIEEAVVVGNKTWSVPVQRYGPLRMQWRHQKKLKHGDMLGLDMTTVVEDTQPRDAVIATVLDYFDSTVSVFIRYQAAIVAAIAIPVGPAAAAPENQHNIAVLQSMFYAFFNNDDVELTAQLSVTNNAVTSTATEIACTDLRLAWRDVVLRSEHASVYEIPNGFGGAAYTVDGDHKLAHVVHGDVHVNVGGRAVPLHKTQTDFFLDWKRAKDAYYTDTTGTKMYIFYPDPSDQTEALNVDCEDEIKVKLKEIIENATNFTQQQIEFKIEETTTTSFGVDTATLHQHITAQGIQLNAACT
jgi:hypothetical protein